MIIHTMGLYEEPFNSIKSGRKTVEVRLNDEKRRNIKPGDTIEFIKLPEENQTLKVEVLQLRTFFSFREMYESIPSEEFDAKGWSIDQMIERTYKIYTPEKEREWGTVAITIKVIK